MSEVDNKVIPPVNDTYLTYECPGCRDWKEVRIDQEYLKAIQSLSVVGEHSWCVRENHAGRPDEPSYHSVCIIVAYSEGLKGLSVEGVRIIG